MLRFRPQQRPPGNLNTSLATLTHSRRSWTDYNLCCLVDEQCTTLIHLILFLSSSIHTSVSPGAPNSVLCGVVADQCWKSHHGKNFVERRILVTMYLSESTAYGFANFSSNTMKCEKKQETLPPTFFSHH